MKRILFWLIIGATVLMVLLYSGMRTVMNAFKKEKKEGRNERVSALMRDARCAMIK